MYSASAAIALPEPISGSRFSLKRPVVTAGGLLFIGATNFDRTFRAFDKATGELLWQTMLPFSGNGTPATYEVNGRQYVVVPAGGGKAQGQLGQAKESGGVYVAFALP